MKKTAAEKARGAPGTTPKSGRSTPNSSETSPTTTGGNLRPVTTTLPKAHLRILVTEAETLDLKKNQLLAMLVRRRAGAVTLGRASAAPQYEFSENDLVNTERYVWLVSPETHQMFEEQRIGLGGIPPQSYLIFLLNDWIGRPEGFKKDRDGKYR